MSNEITTYVITAKDDEKILTFGEGNYIKQEILKHFEDNKYKDMMSDLLDVFIEKRDSFDMYQLMTPDEKDLEFIDIAMNKGNHNYNDFDNRFEDSLKKYIVETFYDVLTIINDYNSIKEDRYIIVNSHDVQCAKCIPEQKLNIYLAGYIGEFDYREYVKQNYSKKFDIIDPVSDEMNSIENVEEKMENKSLYTDEDIEEIVVMDKQKILQSDCVIAYVTKFSAGTMMEIMFAFENEIPVLLIDPSGNFRYDVWIRYHMEEAFDDIDSCFSSIESW